MAFTGAAVSTKLSSSSVVVTGLSLAAGAAGNFGNNGDATSEVQLPAGLLGLSANSTIVSIEDATGLGLLNVTWTGAPVHAVITNNNAADTGALIIKISTLIH